MNRYMHFFLLFRDLEEALSMGMDWSLREGTTGLFVGLFFFFFVNDVFIFQYCGTPLIS